MWKNISEKYPMLPLNKLHLIKEITINLIMFYLEHSSGSYVKLAITLER
jgi:hypothetical protein